MAKKARLPAKYDENPEWTKETTARSVPIEDRPDLAALFPRRGRPKSATTKKPVSLRLSEDVIDKFKSTGKGWQTMIDDVLRKAKIETKGAPTKPGAGALKKRAQREELLKSLSTPVRKRA